MSIARGLAPPPYRLQKKWFLITAQLLGEVPSFSA